MILKVYAFLMLSFATVADAQVIAQTSSQGPAVTSGKVSLVAIDIQLSAALEKIASSAGVRILYTPSEPALSRHVNVNLHSVSAIDAFKQVLDGTGLSIATDESGTVLIRRPSRVRAQGVIAGKITDAKTGRGIAGANISVNTDNRGVTSDESGAYRLAGIPSGTYTVTVRVVGYAKQSRIATVREDATVTADFRLEMSANILDQVVVTGTIVQTELKAVPNAITVVTAKQIEERGITRIDQLFRGEVPGLFSLDMGSNALLDEVVMFSRGATALVNGSSGSSSINNNINALTNSIKTYIDGIEMADSRYLSQIDPSSIERIEILTGPQASTIYGANAINGVMQIFTKRGRNAKHHISLNLQSGVAQNTSSARLAPTHLTDVNLTGIEGRISYNMGGSWNYTGSWTPGKQTRRLGYNGGSRTEWAKTAIDVSARRGLTRNKQNGNINQGSIDLIAVGIYNPSASAGLPQPQTQVLTGQTFGLSMGFRPLSWWSHNAGLGFDASVTEAITGAPGLTSPQDTLLTIGHNSTTSRTSQSYTTTMQIPVSILARLDLTIGGNHFSTKGSSWRSFNTSLTGSLANTSITRDRLDKNSGAFVQGQLAIKDALFLTYGMRAEWNSTFGKDARVLPGRYGISITNIIGSVSTKMRGSYGRSIRPPSRGQSLSVSLVNAFVNSLFGAFDSQLANPDLGPEFQQGGEGGIELYFGSRASLVITRYNQTVDNLILNTQKVDSARSIRVPIGAIDNLFCGGSTFRDTDGYCYRYQSQFLNAGSIRNQGWELQESLNFGPFTTKGTYSWTKSRTIGVTPKYRALLPGFIPGSPFQFHPEHTWGLGFVYSHSAGFLSLSLNGIGMRYISGDALSAAVAENNRFLTNRPRIADPSTIASIYRPVDSGYITADLNTSYRFSSSLDAILQITNLTNYYQNDYNVLYATVGRQSRIGTRFHF